MTKIGKDIKIQAQEYKGKTYIAIRRWYEEDGEEKPGRQGINLKPEEWQEIMDKLEDIKTDLGL